MIKINVDPKILLCTKITPWGFESTLHIWPNTRNPGSTNFELKNSKFKIVSHNDLMFLAFVPNIKVLSWPVTVADPGWSPLPLNIHLEVPDETFSH